MSNLNQRLKELGPYVLSIRFSNGLSVLDTVFKEGWALPKSDDVGFEPVPSLPNHFMLYGLAEDIGVEEMLDYVDFVIKVNIERELKIQLLQEKIAELKGIFSTSSLEKCKTLKFILSDVDTFNNDDVNDLPILPQQNKKAKGKKTEPVKEEAKKVVNKEEEFIQQPTARFGGEEFDLPPKKGDKIIVEDFEEPMVICKCDPNDPNQVCPECIDNKM